MPVHTSFTQAKVQAMPLSHVPSFLQVYCRAPSHFVDPGLQTPAQAPVTHRYGQVASSCHMPDALHV